MTKREQAIAAELLLRLEHALDGTPKQAFSMSRKEARAVTYALRESLGLPKVETVPA